MKIYWNTNGYQCDNTGERALDANTPRLHYAEQPTWEIYIYEGSVPAVLTDIVTWRAAVDKDFSAGTTPMCRSLSSGISVSGNKISVLLNAFTSSFLAGVSSLTEEYGDAYFELWGYDASVNPIFYMRIPIQVSGTCDPEGGDPPATPTGYITEAEALTWIRKKNVYQFSADGLTNWHDTFASTDYYYRERKDIEGSAWGAALPLGRSGVIIDNINKAFSTTQGQAASITFTKEQLGIASDSEPQLSLWNITGATLRDALTAGTEATQIVLTMNDYPTADFPSSGTVTLMNSNGQNETFEYTMSEEASGFMRLANHLHNFTPQNSYASGDASNFALRTQINTASYIAKWTIDSLILTYYTTWPAASWIIKFS